MIVKAGTGALLLSLLLNNPAAQAAHLASSCYVMADGQSAIQGENIDKKLPIASVSKVATSYFATTEGGTEYQFKTVIHVKPTDVQNVYDIHIEGSRDPFFGKESLHYMISGLNKAGITQIHNLTFDENFKFFWSTTASSVAQGHYDTSSPSAATVKSQLLITGSMLTGYNQTALTAKESGFDMVAKPSFSVKAISAVNKTNVNLDGETKVFYIKSSRLTSLMKEMNRNSNNNAANQMFEHFGGAAKFNNLVSEKLKLTNADIEFVNGSGDRSDTTAEKYNSASCKAMLTILMDFQKTLKAQNKNLEDVMSVAGVGTNTLGGRFTNDITQDALIAKTGFVSPARTLAGVISTQQGEVFFMYNFAIDGTANDRNIASNTISSDVTKLIKKFGGPKELNAKPVKFISFDGDSFTNVELEPVSTKP